MDVADDVAGEGDPEGLHAVGLFLGILGVDEVDGFDGIKRGVVDFVAEVLGVEGTVDVMPDAHSGGFVVVAFAEIDGEGPIVVVVDFLFVDGVFLAFDDIGKCGGGGKEEGFILGCGVEFWVAGGEDGVKFGLFGFGELEVCDVADDSVPCAIPGEGRDGGESEGEGEDGFGESHGCKFDELS